jgi:hypothetical protein
MLRKGTRTTADEYFAGTRPCSDLAAPAVAVLVSPEVALPSTAPVANVVLPDKRIKTLVNTASRKLSQTDMRLEREVQVRRACHGGDTNARNTM